VTAILDAAARILERDGNFAAFNTNRVAELAGVSVGSLYQYFPNKEALLAGLQRRRFQTVLDILQQVDDSHRGRPLRDLLAALVRGLVAFGAKSPRLDRTLDLNVAGPGELDLKAATYAEGHRRLRAMLEPYHAALAVPDLDLACFIIGRLFESVLRAAAEERPGDLISGRIADELLGLLCRYLGA
jgi:AcrR family transcriptional regulator